MDLFKFSFELSPAVQSDCHELDIKSLDERGLYRMAKGVIHIFIMKENGCITIESEVLYYLIQLKDVFYEIDYGNHKTFTVSRDYYNNNLRFTYNHKTKELEIYEVNGADFKFLVHYQDFRSAFMKFYKKTLIDLKLLYPELKENPIFMKL